MTTPSQDMPTISIFCCLAAAYDDNGNITSITRGTVSVTYEYNGANELIRENNQFTNQTMTYSIWASTEG